MEHLELEHSIPVLPELVYQRALTPLTCDNIVLRSINEKGEEYASLTWRELHQSSSKLACEINKRAKEGDRVLLIGLQEMEFAVAFLACLYARTVAVPVNLPSKRQLSSRLINVLEDAQCSLILSSEKSKKNCLSRMEGLDKYAHRWLATDTIENNAIDVPFDFTACSPDTLALLQYTSGSTGKPKGVMISYANLTDNSEFIRQSLDLDQDSCIVTWLPMFHDMGLIGNLVQTLHTGGSCVMMAPAVFLRKPALWLEMISRYRGTHAGGPNFGFNHVLRRVDKDTLLNIDLSSWKVAFCGAEPVRESTLTQFIKHYAPMGFPSNAFIPCYGMAEGTLAVSAARQVSGAEYESVQDANGNLRAVASCGIPGPDTEVLVVEPEKRMKTKEGEVGEIWVRGPSISKGYWNKPELSETAFKATLANSKGDTEDAYYYRSGDLGFMKNGHLFVTGRLSDLIIIRGNNYYPQDIEHHVEHSNSAFVNAGTAAFSVDENDEEGLVIVTELERSAVRNVDKESLFRGVQHALSLEFGLQCKALVMLKPGMLLKTSSGKVQRRSCKSSWLEGRLEGVVASFSVDTPLVSESPDSLEKIKHIQPTAPDAHSPSVTLKLKSYLANRVKLQPEQIDEHLPLAHFGFDSVDVAELSIDLEDMFGVTILPEDFYNYPDIHSLSARITTKVVSSDEERTPLPSGTASPTGFSRPDVSPVSESKKAEESPNTVETKNEPIAIVGMAAQFPGAKDIDEYWASLAEGRDCVQEIPEARWALDGFFDENPDAPNRSYSKWGGFIDDADAFDPQFFNISPIEAEFMDPQQRLFLQQSWKALEHAGYPDGSLSGSACSVFVGCSDGDYRRLIEQSGQNVSAYSLMGNTSSILAARIAYYLNLRGECFTVDTACSSSLMAVHLACENLRAGRSDMALAGGVCILSTPQFHTLAAKAGMLSRQGRCKTFDQSGDGFVPAEGVGVVVLKPLSAAIADGDTIHGVIKASGSNQDGRTNGITAPSGLAQTELELSVYKQGNVDPRTIGYVEAHGTGTRLGDPIEVDGLTSAFRQFTPDSSYCAIGSVKSNIGHALAAAGVAGLIKAVLSVKEGKLLPTLHVKNTNPHINFTDSPFYLVDRLKDWPQQAEDLPRVAAISSFGFSGSNVHMVVESFPPTKPKVGPQLAQMLILSAKTETALKQQVSALRDWLVANPEIPLYDVASTLALRRNHFNCRAAVVADSPAEACRQLENWLDEHTRSNATRLDLMPVKSALAAISENRKDGDDASVDLDALTCLAGHYEGGATLPWETIFLQSGNHVALPQYPFAKERYWQDISKNHYPFVRKEQASHGQNHEDLHSEAPSNLAAHNLTPNHIVPNNIDPKSTVPNG
ncbi:hypothetical protein CS022_23845 [Veronia nyctiphanis]|uniref:Uncharacterized protein n=1 Tax=Veronia nyctiphanis TaxID=1278244 RepID=A0A4Q0YFS2_9GAMM|nr:beta-ketoacyl synthase N-terminal-like domain-containing protein [Veronia nyctiphanis]RXJ69412.1 hypothetical protein CS022_23845 [Veronia nyctiphanis]